MNKLRLPDCDVVRVLGTGYGPYPLQSIVEGRLQPVSARMPQSKGPVLRSCQDDWQVGVELHC